MRILQALTYYRPHISGLTIYVERLARALAARGHDVTVLASRHDERLASHELAEGVQIVRVPVAFAVSKGVVMPSYPARALQVVRGQDVVNVHLPQFEAWILALLARARSTPCIATYHCDLELPPGLASRAVERIVTVANLAAAGLATRVVAYTRDYADHSPFLRRFPSELDVVLPPVVAPEPAAADVAALAEAHALGDGGRGPTLGFAGRFATEKGIETLVEATPILAERFPDFQLLLAGPRERVIGERGYQDRVAPALRRVAGRWRFLGPLDPAREMPAFFRLIDCLLVPSVNSTESFGLVQVEAMLCGTPVVASDLPGVREPIRMTGMGEVVPPRDAAALARAVTRLLEGESRWRRPRDEVERLFDVERTVDRYEEIYRASLGSMR